MRVTKIALGGAFALATIALLTTGTRAFDTFGSWPATSVPYYVNPSNGDVSAGSAEAAVQAGADAWGAQSNAGFRFTYAGRATDATTGYDARNVVIFRNTSNGSALATTYYWTSGGRLVDADIIFWDGGWTFFAGSSGCSGGAYIEDVAAHEFGHALGLKHSTVADATMYPTYSRCSQDMRSLASDDIAGVEALYPPVSSNSPPSVAITAPSNGASYMEGAAIGFSGSATDPEDGTLSSRLTWSSNRDGFLGSGASVTRVLSVGTHSIEARVTDSDGQTASRQITVTVNPPPNSAPTVTIAAPANNTSVQAGTSLTFSGSAADAEEGTLTSRLVWNSSLDGPMGMGGSVTRALSAGTHTVTAAVSDSAGLSGSAWITVNVATTTSTPVPAPVPPVITLSVQAYKSKGVQSAELSWSGATSAYVDVYRNGVKVQTTENDGTASDSPGKRGSGSLTYQVCAAGTSTCSATVTASVR